MLGSAPFFAYGFLVALIGELLPLVAAVIVIAAFIWILVKWILMARRW